MSIFKELAELYSEIDDKYATEEFIARANNLTEEEQEFSQKRELNDHAYYLFMFTRLEDYVREQSSRLITENQKRSLNWEQRRAWSILPKDKKSDKIAFLIRVALLLKNGTDSHHYQKIKDYYDLRNTLAHGGKFHTPMSIPTVVTDFESFYKMLKANND
jgi:hypothetical protein